MEEGETEVGVGELGLNGSFANTVEFGNMWNLVSMGYLIGTHRCDFRHIASYLRPVLLVRKAGGAV